MFVFSLLVALMIGVLVAGTATADPQQPSGPDVASWQHGGGPFINWFEVRGAGHDFVMVKATEGLTYVNPYFVLDSLTIRAAGLARGVYHYARPSQSPELQAGFFSTVVLGANGPLDLPPVLDLETSGGLPAPALINWTHRFLDAVQAITGRVPVIYTYPNFWRTAMANSPEFTRYPLWIADYRRTQVPGPLPGGWSTWTFWQRTDCGQVPGIVGCTDIDVFNGRHGDFDGMANR